MTFSGSIKKIETHEILQKLILLKEISVAELARRIKLPQPTVQRIAAGTYKNPRSSTLKPIADFFGVSLSQLSGYDPIPFLTHRNNTFFNIPLFTISQLTTHQTNKAEQAHEYMVCDLNVSHEAFATHMPDASMEPLIPKGSTLLIDPQKVSHHRSFIAVKLDCFPEVIIRQLITDAKNRFIKPLCPDLNQFDMTLLEPHDVILGTIVQIRLNC